MQIIPNFGDFAETLCKINLNYKNITSYLPFLYCTIVVFLFNVNPYNELSILLLALEGIERNLFLLTGSDLPVIK